MIKNGRGNRDEANFGRIEIKKFRKIIEFRKVGESEESQMNQVQIIVIFSS
jgi:hypothetical protein